MLLLKDKAALLRALSVVAALQMFAGCLPPDGNAPPIELRVRQVDGQVSFESILQDRMLFLIPHPVRLRVSTLQVKDLKGKVIWMIHSSHSDPHAVGQEIHYGSLPDGFKQMMPREGRAPDLKVESEYAVEISWGVIGGTSNFIYEGRN